MKRRLTTAEINHLRRLLGWVACEVGQTPEDMVETVRQIATSIQDVDEAGKARLVEAHQRASAVPKYIRAAVKALRKAIDPDVVTVDGVVVPTPKELPAQVAAIPHMGANT